MIGCLRDQKINHYAKPLVFIMIILTFIIFLLGKIVKQKYVFLYRFTKQNFFVQNESISFLFNMQLQQVTLKERVNRHSSIV